jgi:hypothetical protein
MPTLPRTRLAALATAAYAGYALVQPEHLHRLLPAHITPQESRRLSLTYAGRDLPISLLGVLGPGPAVPVALGLRLAGDVTDAATLGSTTSGSARAKVLGASMGWAAVNVAAFALDRRR